MNQLSLCALVMLLGVANTNAVGSPTQPTSTSNPPNYCVSTSIQVNVTLSCSAGDVITIINNAYYGNDTGVTCTSATPTFPAPSSCDPLYTITAFIIEQCTGLQTCEVYPSDQWLTSPYACAHPASLPAPVTTGKVFAVSYVCGQTQPIVPNPPDYACITTGERSSSTIVSCPEGEIIDDILFYDYGLPSGCNALPLNTYFSNPACSIVNASFYAQVLASANSHCLDQSSCYSYSSSSEVFFGPGTATSTTSPGVTKLVITDPCIGFYKLSIFAVQCTPAQYVYTGSSTQEPTDLSTLSPTYTTTSGITAVQGVLDSTVGDPFNCVTYSNGFIGSGSEIKISSTTYCCSNVGLTDSSSYECVTSKCGDPTGTASAYVALEEPTNGPTKCYTTCFAFGSLVAAAESLPKYRGGSNITSMYPGESYTATIPSTFKDVFIYVPGQVIDTGFQVLSVTRRRSFNGKRTLDPVQSVACRRVGIYESGNCKYNTCNGAGNLVPTPWFYEDAGSSTCYYDCVTP